MSQINPNIYDKINIEEHNSNPQLQLNITNNQIINNNFELLALSTVLKSNPQFIVCPFCHNITPSRTEKNINIKNAICLCLSPILWGIHQTLRNKDLTCYDSKHFCIKCNAYLGSYQSC